MVGKNAARAAPILALADNSWFSAARMSGRRSSRSDGRPEGTVASSWSRPNVAGAGNVSGSGVPTTSTSAFMAWARARASCARSADAVSSSDLD
ncbi:hypothetical protein D3C86_1290190 [compost metagenome]